MGIDTFTTDEFDKTIREIVFPHEVELLGVIDGEYCYLIKINHNIGIYVRSSIGRDGYSATVGEDSIRVFLVQYSAIRTLLSHKLSYKVYRTDYLGKAGGRWTTRVKGWQNRLRKVIRELIEWTNKAQYCPHCKDQPLHFFKVKKEGKNKGRIFATCPNKYHDKVFIWIT